MESNSEHQSGTWRVCGSNFPRSEIVFLTQMVLVYTIVITSLINLTLDSAQHDLWLILLSSSLGYALPNPRIKNRNRLMYPPGL